MDDTIVVPHIPDEKQTEIIEHFNKLRISGKVVLSQFFMGLNLNNICNSVMH